MQLVQRSLLIMIVYSTTVFQALEECYYSIDTTYKILVRVIPNIYLYYKYVQALTLILVLLPASSTRTDACFFLLDVNFPLLCDPDLTGSGDPAMVTFLPLKTKIRVIKFAPFSNRLYQTDIVYTLMHNNVTWLGVLI